MKRLLLLALVCPLLNAMEMVPYSARDQIKVLSNGRNIFVEDEDAAYRIPSHQQNTLLREVLKRNAMSKFVGEDGDGYVRVDKNAEGKYVLAAKVRGNGGGPILGSILYGTVKALAYGGLVVMGGTAAVTVSVATGGTATPLIAAGAVAAKGAVGASIGVAMAGSAIATTSAGAALGAGATAGIATAGVGGFIAGVEAAALWAFGLGMAAPTI